MQEFFTDLFSTPMDVVADPEGHNASFSSFEIAAIRHIQDKDKQQMLAAKILAKKAAKAHKFIFSTLQLAKINRIKSRLNQQQYTALMQAFEEYAPTERMSMQRFSEHLLLQGILNDEQKFAVFHNIHQIRPQNGQTVLYTEPYYLFGFIPWGRINITVADIAKRFLAEGIHRDPKNRQPLLTPSQNAQLEALRRKLLVDNYETRKNTLDAIKQEMQTILLSRLKNGVIQITKKQTIPLQSIRGLSGLFNFLTTSIDQAIPNKTPKPRVSMVKMVKSSKPLKEAAVQPLPQPILIVKPDLSKLQTANDADSVIILRNILRYCETINGQELIAYLNELSEIAKKVKSRIIQRAIDQLENIFELPLLVMERCKLAREFNEIKHHLSENHPRMRLLSTQLVDVDDQIETICQDQKKSKRLAYRQFFATLAKVQPASAAVRESKRSTSPVLAPAVSIQQPSALETKEEKSDAVVVASIFMHNAVVAEPTSTIADFTDITPVKTATDESPVKIDHEVLIDLYYHNDDKIDREPKDKLFKQLGVCFKINNQNTLGAMTSFYLRNKYANYSEEGSVFFQASMDIFNKMPVQDQARALKALIVYAYKHRDEELKKYFRRRKITAKNTSFWSDENSMPPMSTIANDAMKSVGEVAKTAAGVATTAATGIALGIGAFIGFGM